MLYLSYMISTYHVISFTYGILKYPLRDIQARMIWNIPEQLQVHNPKQLMDLTMLRALV